MLAGESRSRAGEPLGASGRHRPFLEQGHAAAARLGSGTAARTRSSRPRRTHGRTRRRICTRSSSRARRPRRPWCDHLPDDTRPGGGRADLHKGGDHRPRTSTCRGSTTCTTGNRRLRRDHPRRGMGHRFGGNPGPDRRRLLHRGGRARPLAADVVRPFVDRVSARCRRRVRPPAPHRTPSVHLPGRIAMRSGGSSA